MTTYDLAMAQLGLIYARVSTDETKQVSMPDQIELSRAALLELGYIVPEDGVFKDEMSRQVWQRPGLQGLLRRCMDPRVGAVCVWQFSRLYGDNEQRVKIYRVLTKQKVRLFDKDRHEENLPGAMNKLVSSLRGVINEFEVDQTSERVHDMHKQKATRGIILQQPVFGISHTAERGHFINEAQLPTVQLIFQWAAEGVEPQEICDRLNAQGVRTIRGFEWRKHNLRRMLRNEIYKGVLVWNKTASYRDEDGKRKSMPRPESEWVSAESPLGPLVDPDLFDRAGSAIARRWKVKGGGRGHRTTPVRLLEGFVFCGRCEDERRMYPRRTAHPRKDGSKGDWFTYTCAVNQHSMSEGKILRLLGQWVAGIDNAANVTVTVQGEEHADTQEEEAVLQALQANKEKRRRSQLAHEDGTIELEDLREAMARHRAEKATLEARLAALELKRSASVSQQMQDTVREAIGRAMALVTDETIEVSARRAFMEYVFARLVVSPGQLEIALPQSFELEDLAS